MCRRALSVGLCVQEGCGMKAMWSTTAIFNNIIKLQPSNISKMKTVDGKIGKVEACQIIASHYRRLTLQ